jgi:hypothetical protein
VRTYKCDRCGKQFAESGPLDPPQSPANASPLELGLTIKLPVSKDERIILPEVDLCGGCVYALVQWMTIKRKE